MATKKAATATRTLGTLTSADLGIQILEPKRTDGPLARNHRPRAGKLTSVHHFQVEGVRYTAAIILVPRTEVEVKKREADHREIRGLSDTEVETP